MVTTPANNNMLLNDTRKYLNRTGLSLFTQIWHNSKVHCTRLIHSIMYKAGMFWVLLVLT